MKKLTSLLTIWSLTVISGAIRAFGEEMGVITCGQTERGEISVPAERDSWTFSGQEDEAVLIDAEQTSDGWLNPWIELYPPGGNVPVASDDQFVFCKLPKSGTYTIKVHDSGEDHTGSYNLSMYNLQSCVWPTIACGETTTACIDLLSEMDLYQFEGRPGERVLIDAEQLTGNLVLWVALYPPDGSNYLVVEKQPVDSSHVLILHELDEDGIYTIRVSDYGTDETGCYSVTLTGGVGSPEVSTLPAEDVKATCVTLVGKLVDDGGEACECWFCYWQEGQAEQCTDPQDGKKSGDPFSVSLGTLLPATTYHYRAYASNSIGTDEGGPMTFTTGVRLELLWSEGGRVVEPEDSVVELPVPAWVNVLAQPNPDWVFWRWEGTAADKGNVGEPGAPATPDTSVWVDWDDTLMAAFLPVADPCDDRNPAPCRGSDLSTSQYWNFGDGADSRPQDLYGIGGIPRNGLAPLPGTQLKPLDATPPEGNQSWATDTMWGSERQGLLALPALRALLHVWPSVETTTTIRVQCVWHAYDGSDSSPLLARDDGSSPVLIQDIVLDDGWCHSTYEWTVAPSPEVATFVLQGQVVLDTLIVDTCTKGPDGVIHVDDDALLDPGPNDASISDPLEDGSPEHPFDRIQEGIDAATQGDVVVVHAGRYFETIQLPAGNITVVAEWLVDSSILAASILDAGGTGPAVYFTGPKGVSCRLNGLTIVGGKSATAPAILCEQADPVISHCLVTGNMATGPGGAVIVCRDSQARFGNCTLSGNRAGTDGAVLSFRDSEIVVLNSIVWDNDGSLLGVESGSPPQVLYSDVQGGAPGLGILDSDPLFTAPGFWQDNGTALLADDIWIEGDYHLQSRQGRLDPEVGSWVIDPESSPCVDAGDPYLPWHQEPVPNGGRTNLGTYGATSQASRSP